MLSAVRCQRIQACKHRCRYTNQCIRTRVEVLMCRRGAVCFICWLLIKMWIVQRIYVYVCTSSTRRQVFAHSELQSHCMQWIRLLVWEFVLLCVCFDIGVFSGFVLCLQYVCRNSSVPTGFRCIPKKATKNDEFAVWPREGASRRWHRNWLTEDRTLSAHKSCSYYCLQFCDCTNIPDFQKIIWNFEWKTDRQIEFNGTTAFRNHRWRMCFGCQFFRQMHFVCGWGWQFTQWQQVVDSSRTITGK